jgi:hypothetical protein
MTFDINSPVPTLDSTGSASTFSTGKFFTQKYNQLDHKVEFFLDNSGNFDGNPNFRYQINPQAILSLNIEDILTDWVVEGTMCVLYMPDDSPAVSVDKTGNPAETAVVGAAQENGKMLGAYQFRGDGMDMLRVMIVPKTTNEIANGFTINENDPKWILSYMFSIINVEDVNDLPELQGPAAAYMKCVKLTFHDVRQQILTTSNIEYSTVNSPEARWGTQCANDGVLKTGAAILEIWNKVLGSPEDGGCIEFIQTKDPERWDEGSSELFYTSPAGWNAAEDIEYLLDHHTSSQDLKNSSSVEVPPVKDLCVMHTERPKSQTQLEKICITPLTKFFKRSTEGSEPGELQLEHFFVTSHTEKVDRNGKTPTKTYKAPIGQTDDRDLKTFKYGQIISYSFLDMSPVVNSTAFSTTPVYSVDVGRRKFSVKFKDNDVITARRLLAENYITELYPKGAPDETLFLPWLHKTKQKRNIFPAFSLNGDVDPGGIGDTLRQKNGIGQLLYTGLFQNACITFKTFGLTLRESGIFIGIDKTDGTENTDFNNKLYGQWFVIKVDHTFEAGTYMNVIYAIKIRRFEPPKLKLPSTI